jgi:N6-adenosine-specific RNA methylase IME4
MIEEKSPTGQGRAEEVFSDQTNSPPVPTTQENCTISLPRGKYGVTYVNPSPFFVNWRAMGTGRNAFSHYGSLEELAAALRNFTANDCALFWWPVGPLLDKPFELFRTCGFEYEAAGFFSVKQNIRGEGFFTDLGFWTRASPELCLLATRGKPKRWARDVPSLVFVPRISPRHSRSAA